MKNYIGTYFTPALNNLNSKPIKFLKISNIICLEYKVKVISHL